MPPRSPLGLSNLGMTAPTQSSGVQSDSQITLEDMLFDQDAVVNQQKRVSRLDEEIAAAEGTEKPGLLEQFKDPRVLIPLLLGLGGAAAGGGVGAALGGVVGGTANALAGQQVDAAGQSEAVEVLKEDRKQAVEDLEKTRNRISTLFNTNPEAFVDSEGAPLSPQVMGWYATGVPFHLSTTARRTAEERGVRWTKRAEFLMEGLKGARSAEDARQLAGEMLSHLGEKNPEPGFLDTLVNSYGTPKFDSTWWSHVLSLGPNTGALVHAAENGLQPDDPEVLRLIKLYPKETSVNKESWTDRELSLLDRVSRWTLDPNNEEFVNQIRAEAGGDLTQEAIGMTMAAISDDPASAQTLAMKFKKDDLLAEQFASYKNQLAGEQMIDRLKVFGGGNFEKMMNETPDDAVKRRGRNAQIEVGVNTAAAEKDQINSTVSLRSNAAKRMSIELPTLGHDAVYDLVDQVYKKALEDTPVDEKTGRKDMKTFQSLFNDYTKQAIEQNK